MMCTVYESDVRRIVQHPHQETCATLSATQLLSYVGKTHLHRPLPFHNVFNLRPGLPRKHGDLQQRAHKGPHSRRDSQECRNADCCLVTLCTPHMYQSSSLPSVHCTCAIQSLWTQRSLQRVCFGTHNIRAQANIEMPTIHIYIPRHALNSNPPTPRKTHSVTHACTRACARIYARGWTHACMCAGMHAHADTQTSCIYTHTQPHAPSPAPTHMPTTQTLQ